MRLGQSRARAQRSSASTLSLTHSLPLHTHTHGNPRLACPPLQQEYARLRELARVLAEEEKVEFEARERESLRNARQAEQRRQLIQKATVERTLDALRKARPKVAEEN